MCNPKDMYVYRFVYHDHWADGSLCYDVREFPHYPTIAAPSGVSKSLFRELISRAVFRDLFQADSVVIELCVVELCAVSGLAFSWTLIEGEWREKIKTLTNNYFKKCFSRKRKNLKNIQSRTSSLRHRVFTSA